jgi:hypothetical protein
MVHRDELVKIAPEPISGRTHPLSPETSIAGAKVFAAMKPTAHVVTWRAAASLTSPR